MQLLVIQLLLRCFTWVLCKFSYYSRWNLNIIKSLKHVIFTIKCTKIIMLLQFSLCQSVCWPYIQSVCRCYCRAGPVSTESVCVCVCVCVCVSSCVMCLRNLARYWLQGAWGWHKSVETCKSVIICEIIVHLLVRVQNRSCKDVFVRAFTYVNISEHTWTQFV